MLNSGEKNCALRDKKINVLTLVLSEKKFLNETKSHTPPFKLNGHSQMVRTGIKQNLVTKSHWVLLTCKSL